LITSANGPQDHRVIDIGVEDIGLGIAYRDVGLDSRRRLPVSKPLVEACVTGSSIRWPILQEIWMSPALRLLFACNISGCHGGGMGRSRGGSVEAPDSSEG